MGVKSIKDDLLNKKYNRWLVIKEAPRKNKLTYWLCRCVCGTVKIVVASSLKNGRSKSCGCLKRERTSQIRKSHGKSESCIYNTWLNMLQRCNNPNNSGYKYYGDRGIVVEWKTFEDFYADMGDPPKGKSLDRINTNGNYSKENCRWATQAQQGFNRRPKGKNSKYRGITMRGNSWRARIVLKNVEINIGHYKTEEEAYQARLAFIEAHKEDLPL